MLTLTPQARAIAALTLSVLLVLGDLNKIWLAFALLLGNSYPSGRGGQFLTGLVLVAIAVAVAVNAAAAVRSTGAGTTWDSHLAGAAVVIAGVGVLIAVLLAFGGVVNGSGNLPTGSLGGATYGL